MRNILSAKPDNAQFIALTDEQVADMDETADFMHQKPAFKFGPSGITFGRQPKPEKLFKGLKTIRQHGISITSAAQGQTDADRRDALKRGGI
jgi:hypothetical protein